jgi:hypothetical protein
MMKTVRHVALARNQDGRLELVATVLREDHIITVWHAWQTPSGGWAGWKPLANEPFSVFSPPPTVARNTDGRLEVAVLGLNRAAWHSSQTTPGGNWTSWQWLGAPARGSRRPLALAQNQDGRLELFWIDHGAVWHAWQTVPGDDWTGGWHALGSPSDTVTLDEGSPVVARNEDGRLELFVRANDGAVWHRWQREAGTASWAAWSSLESPGDQPASSEPPVVVRNRDGRLVLFIVAGNDTVWHRWQQAAQAGPWGAWRSFGSMDDPDITHPPIERIELAAGAHADGRLVLFAVAVLGGSGASLVRQRELTGAGDWSPWKTVDSPARKAVDLAAVSDALGRLQLFMADEATGELYQLSQLEPNGPAWASVLWPPPPAALLTELPAPTPVLTEDPEPADDAPEPAAGPEDHP